ncbi:PKS-ER domain-containing protein [Fusarium keratoplasticum]|nr:PKS-ER domain-containing protein [Fusarium keratoplasticum]
MSPSSIETKLPNLSLQVGPDHELKLVNVPVPSPKHDEVLIKVKGWDLSDIYFWKAGGIGPLRIENDYLRGPIVRPIPHNGAAEDRVTGIGRTIGPLKYILGHEGSGVVVQCAPDVDSLQVGDRVAIEAPMPCENCQFCQSGRRNMCSNLRIIGVYPTDGALQRYMVHPAKLLHKLPDNISFANAALLEPLSVAIQGIRDAGGLPLGSAALICGAGPIGLLTLAAARASGAHPLVITDIEPTRLEFAQKLVSSCFTYKVDTNLTPEENAKAIRQLYGPGEYSAPETVLECTGADISALVGFHAARMSSKLVIPEVGKGTFTDFPTELMMGKMVTFYQVLSQLLRYLAGWHRLTQRGLINLDLITHSFLLEKADEAPKLAAESKHDTLKVQIVDESDGSQY